MKQTYNKLVRDKIPEILIAKGISAKTRALPPLEFSDALRAKLEEEVAEFMAAKSAEECLQELADIEEVVIPLARLQGYSKAHLERAREHKLMERGAFKKRVFLIETNE